MGGNHCRPRCACRRSAWARGRKRPGRGNGSWRGQRPGLWLLAGPARSAASGHWLTAERGPTVRSAPEPHVGYERSGCYIIEHIGTGWLDSGDYVYVQVADVLAERIGRGEITDRMPVERRLAADLGVAYQTVRHVLQLLRDRGLITTRHGRGSFIMAALAKLDAGPDEPWRRMRASRP
jgi:DNA-binding transcriptional ArsR family regulator